MTKDTTPLSNLRHRVYVRHLGDDVRLEAAVSPCVFMYPGYPLQISVTLHRHPGERLGNAYAVDSAVDATTYTAEAVERLLAKVHAAPCPRCSTPAFDPTTVQTNRGGLCEDCFLTDLNADLVAIEEADRRKLARRDRRMKQKGKVVRVSAWVHPRHGGDDYQIDWYLDHHPTAEQVAGLLRERGSDRLDDYQITIL